MEDGKGVGQGMTFYNIDTEYIIDVINSQNQPNLAPVHQSSRCLFYDSFFPGMFPMLFFTHVWRCDLESSILNVCVSHIIYF